MCNLTVYHLSAQFPGPTTPRDFVTMLLTTDCAFDPAGSDDHGRSERYFYVVSKPCDHPETPETPAFIRGTYESVEVIREIRVPTQNDPLRKIQSSIDLPTDEANAIARSTVNHLAHEPSVRAAHPPALNGVSKNSTNGSADTSVANGEQHPQRTPNTAHQEYETHIEWIMVTRSDPGGSVPRFMVEKGTPAGIAGDADKFLKWVDSKSMQDLLEPDAVETASTKTESAISQEKTEKKTPSETGPTSGPVTSTVKVTKASSTNGPVREEMPSAVPGLFGIITGAYGVATSMLPNPFGSTLGDTSPEAASSTDTGDDEDEDDDKSSIHTFHSFVTGQEDLEGADAGAPQDPLERTNTNGEHSVQSSTESAATRSQHTLSQHEKELRKLEERQRKTEERFQRAQARALAKRNGGGGSNGNGQHDGGGGGGDDDDALAKLREKYDRELAKHEEKHERQRRKLEAKRAAEERKAAERRQKQAEREERRSLAAALDKARAERDVARKQIDVLKEQVGQLQAQNTMLVARLGREGIRLDGPGLGLGLSLGSSAGSGSGHGAATATPGVLASDPRRRSSPVGIHPPSGGARISRASTVLGTPTQHHHAPSPLLGPPLTDRSREHSSAHAERVS